MNELLNSIVESCRLQAKFLIFLFLLLAVSPTLAVQNHTASSLFEEMDELVYQVRVIDIASDDKTTIGSGFQADEAGNVATNFHVISLAAHEPDKYRITLLAHDDSEMTASIVTVDVLNDLAILRPEKPMTTFIPIAKAEPIKGQRIFAIGNPLDLGMSVIEGNYNGLLKTSRFKRLLFSGSLNPGMSGGPAFNENGELIGINVATGGEQISFLVPADKLARLLRNIPGDMPSDATKDIEEELYREQNEFYQAQLDATWKMQDFGELSLPHELSPAMKCWGHNIDDDEVEYEAFHQHCQSEEYIYLKDGFYTGNFSYDFEWMKTDSLNPLQFYTAVQERFNHDAVGNAYDEEDVTEFACRTRFVQVAAEPWRASTCLRQYREFERLYDATLVMVSLKENEKAAVVKMSMTGTSRDNSLAMFEKLLRQVSWKN